MSVVESLEVYNHVELLMYVINRMGIQNRRSMSRPYMCGYRDPNAPVACAVGVCILDEEYDPEMDDLSDLDNSGIESNDLAYDAVCDSLGWEPDRTFLSSLQRIHDNNESAEMNGTFGIYFANEAIKFLPRAKQLDETSGLFG